MKRRILIMLLALTILLGAGTPALATEAEQPQVQDLAELLTEGQTQELDALLLTLKNVLEIDIVIVTTRNLDGKDVMSYADDFYDQQGYGVGSDSSGILLLLSMGTREWYMSTCGEAMYIFTDYGLEQLGQELTSYLSEEEYYDGFRNWAQSLEYYVQQYRQGTPVDGYVPADDYESPYGEEIVYGPGMGFGKKFLIALLVGLAAALITVLIMRSSMNTAHLRSGASDYLKDGSFRLKRHFDQFLYSRVTKTEKPQNNSGGGSSVHRSSGGVSHGGRGGKF